MKSEPVKRFTWDNRHSDPEYVKALERARQHLQEIDQYYRRLVRLRRAAMRYRRQRDEMQRTFDLQWTRMGRAVARWRAEDPAERALVLPDLGCLLQWLMDRADARARP